MKLYTLFILHKNVNTYNMPNLLFIVWLIGTLGANDACFKGIIG